MAKKKSILVVDKDEDTLRALKKALWEKGYIVETAKTGTEAIEKPEAHFYNLVLLEIKLPDMKGTELLTKMPRTIPKMVKIIVTGHPTLENAIEALNLGADAFVVKPVKPEELLKVVEEKLKEQEEAEKMIEEKVAEWIKTRIRKLERERR